MRRYCEKCKKETVHKKGGGHRIAPFGLLVGEREICIRCSKKIKKMNNIKCKECKSDMIKLWSSKSMIKFVTCLWCRKCDREVKF